MICYLETADLHRAPSLLRQRASVLCVCVCGISFLSFLFFFSPSLFALHSCLASFPWLCSASPLQPPIASFLRGALLPLNPSPGVSVGRDCLGSRRCAPLAAGGWRERAAGPGLAGEEKGRPDSMGSAAALRGGWAGEVASQVPVAHDAERIYLADPWLLRPAVM